MLRLLETEFSEAYADLPEEQKQPGGGQKLLAACGVSAAPFLRQMFAAHPLTGLTVEVRALENGFFGPSVTVSGLLTGGDLVRGLRGADVRGGAHLRMHAARWGNGIFGRYDAGRGLPRP